MFTPVWSQIRQNGQNFSNKFIPFRSSIRENSQKSSNKLIPLWSQIGGKNEKSSNKFMSNEYVMVYLPLFLVVLQIIYHWRILRLNYVPVNLRLSNAFLSTK